MSLESITYLREIVEGSNSLVDESNLCLKLCNGSHLREVINLIDCIVKVSVLYRFGIERLKKVISRPINIIISLGVVICHRLNISLCCGHQLHSSYNISLEHLLFVIDSAIELLY